MCPLFKILKSANIPRTQMIIFNKDEYLRITLNNHPKKYLFVFYYPHYEKFKSVIRYGWIYSDEHQIKIIDAYDQLSKIGPQKFSDFLEEISNYVSEKILFTILFNINNFRNVY